LQAFKEPMGISLADGKKKDKTSGDHHVGTTGG